MGSLDTILIIGSKRRGALEGAYADAFHSLGVPVTHFDLERPARRLSANRVLSRLTRRLQYAVTGRTVAHHLASSRRSYRAVIVFKGMQLTPEWITRCRALTGKALWANLNPDDPLNVTSRGSTNGNVVASIRLYDLYATWSRRLIKALKRAGCLHVLYLPFGYDPRLHYPTDQLRGDLKDTITFVGAWDKEREQVLSYLADMPLKVFGFGWDRVGPRSPLQGKVSAHNIYEEELRQVVTSSMASINILRPQNEGSHNMRTFEIPAMRGLMITDYSEEQEEFFPGGRASIMYRDPEELRCQLEKVRMRAYETTEIRSEGYALSQEHSYLRRAGTLLDELGRIEELRSRSPG